MISLVVTVYKQKPHYFTQCINSIREQTFTDFELLIWLDGYDETITDLAFKFQEIDSRLKVYSAAHQGRGLALHHALEKTRGEFIGWVDSDDWLEPKALEITHAALVDAPLVGMVYTYYFDVDSNGKRLSWGSRSRIPYSPHVLLVDFMTFHFRLFRRSLYNVIGGVNPDYSTIEDYEFCLRASEVSPILQVGQKPLYNYRMHPDSICANQQPLQLLLCQKAVNEALIRRGMYKKYKLTVETRPRFILSLNP
jgi:glycosyltransferase involved in cell wall biosynthesis